MKTTGTERRTAQLVKEDYSVYSCRLFRNGRPLDSNPEVLIRCLLLDDLDPNEDHDEIPLQLAHRILRLTTLVDALRHKRGNHSDCPDSERLTDGGSHGE